MIKPEDEFQHLEIVNARSKLLQNVEGRPKDSLRRSVYLMISKDLCLKIQIKIVEDITNIICVVSRPNGSPMTLKSSLLLTFIEKMNLRDDPNWYFFCSSHPEYIKFRGKINVNTKKLLVEGESQKMMIFIKTKIKKIITSLTECLQEFGLIPLKPKRILKFQKAKLKAMKALRQCLQCKQQKDSENKLFHHQLSPKFIKISKIDLQENQNYQNIVWDQIYSTTNYFEIYRKMCKIYIAPCLSPILRQCAIKWPPIKINKSKYSLAIKKLQREEQIIQKLPHCQYFANYWKDPNKKNNLFMQFLPESLTFYINNNICSLQTSLMIYSKILQGIKYMSQYGVIHRDLKPDNILIDSKSGQYIPKIIDFGDSIIYNKEMSKSQQITYHETLPYSAFQCCLGSIIPKPSADIWSAGVILYEIMFKSTIPIYSSFYPEETLLGLSKGQFEFPTVHNKKRGIQFIGYIVSILLNHLIKFEQQQRLSISQLKKGTQILIQFYKTIL